MLFTAPKSWLLRKELRETNQPSWNHRLRRGNLHSPQREGSSQTRLGDFQCLENNFGPGHEQHSGHWLPQDLGSSSLDTPNPSLLYLQEGCWLLCPGRQPWDRPHTWLSALLSSFFSLFGDKVLSDTPGCSQTPFFLSLPPKGWHSQWVLHSWSQTR